MTVQLLVNFQRLRTVALVPVDDRVTAALDIISGEYDCVDRVFDGNHDISAEIATLIYEAQPYGQPMGDCALNFVCHYRPDLSDELHCDRARMAA